MAVDITNWIDAYKKAGGVVEKDSRENDAVPIDNLIKITNQTFEQANQFINSLNLDTNGDKIISIADFPNGKLNFQGQEIDVKLFGLTENTSITVDELKEKLKFLQSSELKRYIKEAVNAADTQNVGMKGEQNDGYITIAELQSLANANKQGITTQLTTAPPPTEQPAATQTASTTTTTTTTSKETAITNADGSTKTAGEVWKENKGLMLGAGGVILGGLMAMFTGGSGWLILLFGLLGFGGGALADNGVFDGRGESSNKNTGTKTEKQNETSAEPQQGQSKEQSLEANLKSFQLKNGDMAVRGTIEGNNFLVKEVVVKRKDGNWNTKENGELLYTPVSGATIIFPTDGENLGNDNNSTKNLDVLQRLGNIGNGEDIGYNTINQNTLNRAKIAAQNLNLPVEQSCITNSLQACTYGIGTQNSLRPAVPF